MAYWNLNTPQTQTVTPTTPTKGSMTEEEWLKLSPLEQQQASQSGVFDFATSFQGKQKQLGDLIRQYVSGFDNLSDRAQEAYHTSLGQVMNEQGIGAVEGLLQDQQAGGSQLNNAIAETSHELKQEEASQQRGELYKPLMVAGTIVGGAGLANALTGGGAVAGAGATPSYAGASYGGAGDILSPLAEKVGQSLYQKVGQKLLGAGISTGAEKLFSDMGRHDAKVQSRRALRDIEAQEKQDIADYNTGVSRTQQDYTTNIDDLARAHHLQNLQTKARLLERGISGDAASSTGEMAWSNLGAEETGQTEGLNRWRSRRLDDLSNQLGIDIRGANQKMAGVNAWRKAQTPSFMDILKQRAGPEALAGIGQQVVSPWFS